jgi:hypothetical protein
MARQVTVPCDVDFFMDELEQPWSAYGVTLRDADVAAALDAAVRDGAAGVRRHPVMLVVSCEGFQAPTLAARAAAYVRLGGTFVYCNDIDLAPFAAAMPGLRWAKAGYGRVTLRRLPAGGALLSDKLPAEYAAKSVYMSGVPPAEALYGAAGDAGSPGDRHVAIARHRHGAGHFVFSGDVNMETSTNMVLLGIVKMAAAAAIAAKSPEAPVAAPVAAIDDGVPPATPAGPQLPTDASEAANNRGRDAVMAGDGLAAIAAYTDAIALAPSVAKYRGNRAQLHMTCSKDFSAAARDARWAVHIEPSNAKFVFRLATALSGINRHREATEAIDAFFPLHGRPTDPNGVRALHELRLQCESAVRPEPRGIELPIAALLVATAVVGIALVTAIAASRRYA